ncbi:tegument protein UL51 [Equid alphaherpesvirus 3]|uniref:Tegument protein UL51 n=1 Tax=Equid alphaherpesvirus 3 TaxID=80341 RepID=A0A077B5W2_9ALPH|nr:tegument protein UL51 [Equid alphaherpesvirus 3]AIL02925.1 tegument protein UL51 [Equid alphaherpesvirus 3]
MLKWIVSSLCGNGSAKPAEVYEPIRGGQNPATMLRLQSALAAVNALLPATLTIEDVVSSADNTRRLVKAQTLARTYRACQHNIECLVRHQTSSDNPSLNAVVATHLINARRLADTCLAALMHIYLSVGAVDATTDIMVDQAIRMTAENSVVMADVAVLEKTLGLAAATHAPVPATGAHARADPAVLGASPVQTPVEDREAEHGPTSPLLPREGPAGEPPTPPQPARAPVKSSLKSKHPSKRRPSAAAVQLC